MLCLLELFSFSIYSQNPFPSAGAVFNDEVLPTIYIQIPQDTLDFIFAPGNEESDLEWPVTFVFDNGNIRDTIEHVGFRLRGNTSRYSQKKSFKLSFNTFEPGRKYYGLEKMNLNGEHNDPSIMRAKLCWDMLEGMEVVGARSNHIRLVVNDVFYGIYLNVEHIDEEFVKLRFGNNSGNLYKCLWPADLQYLGSNPNSYKLNQGERRVYELKTNEAIDDYSDLAHFIDVLNNTPIDERACALEEIFDVQSYLRAMAFDVLSGNWDGPLFNKNNFYLYHDPAIGKFRYIPYDLDNTMGIDWFSVDWAQRDIYEWGATDEPRPLYYKLMEVDRFRELFTFYVYQFINGVFSPGELYPEMNRLKTQITPYILNDPFYPLDYGFSMGDFMGAYDGDLSYNHVGSNLEDYISVRTFHAGIQLQRGEVRPVVSQLENNYVQGADVVNISVQVQDINAIESVQLCYSTTDAAILCVDMFDDGTNGDVASGDGVYSFELPIGSDWEYLSYFVEATDEGALMTTYPFCGVSELYLQPEALPLYINELMADNESTLADEAGEYDDWAEMLYLGDAPLYLGDLYMSDKPDNPTKWQMGDQWINPGEYKIVWLDNDEEQGASHANFKLSSGGEYLGIYNSESNAYAVIDSVSFGEQVADLSLARIPDATGDWLIGEPTPSSMNVPDATDENNIPDIKIFPNPFTDHVKIEYPGVFQWQLFDTRGRLVGGYGKVFGSVSINTFSSWSKGVYFLKLTTEDGVVSIKRLVKM